MFRSFVVGVAGVVVIGCGPSPADLEGDYSSEGTRNMFLTHRALPDGTFQEVTPFVQEADAYQNVPKSIDDKNAFSIVIFNRLFHVAADSTGECDIPVRVAGNDGMPASAAYVGNPGAECVEVRPLTDATGAQDGRQILMLMRDCINEFQCRAAEVRFDSGVIRTYSQGYARVRYPAGTVINGVVEPAEFDLVGGYETEVNMYPQ